MELKLAGSSEYSQIPTHVNKELMLSADIVAPKEMKTAEKATTSIDFVAVIDKSISMGGAPFELVKQSLKFIASNLKFEDQFSIVSFGSEATLNLQLTKMNNQGKQDALKVIEKLAVNGATNLSGGLDLGFEQLRKRTVKNATASILLLTDGVANIGIIETPKLIEWINSKLSTVASSVNVFTFGFGYNHSPQMLTAISDAANGMYYFVEKAETIPKAFAECLGGLLSTMAKDLTLSLTPMKGVEVLEVMTKSKKEKKAGVWKIELGDIYSEEQRNIPLKVKISPSNPTSTQVLVHIELSYLNTRSSKLQNLLFDISIARVQSENSNEAKEEKSNQSKQLDEQKNRMLAAEAFDNAARLGSQGQVAQARKVLEDVLHIIEASVSHNGMLSQTLVRDIKEALSKMGNSDFNHVAAKYLYSLSRSHFNQRSSGISLSGAAAYITSSKKEMMGIDVNSNPSTISSQPVPKSSENTKQVVTTVNREVKQSQPPIKGNNKVIEISKEEAEKTTVVDLSYKNNTVDKARKTKVEVSKELLAKAIKRLMFDWQQIQKDPLSTVTARPLDSDFFEWHCNMRGPQGSEYSGISFHLIFIFPQSYPVDPPKLFMCSYVSHKHVYGSWICLDLLEEAQWSQDEETSKPYTGWTTAYSVQSILLQLQAFLFDKASRDPIEIKKAQQSSQAFECDICGHSFAKPFPEFPKVIQEKPKDSPKPIPVPPKRVVRVQEGAVFIPKRLPKAKPVKKVAKNLALVPIKPADKDAWKKIPKILLEGNRDTSGRVRVEKVEEKIEIKPEKQEEEKPLSEFEAFLMLKSGSLNRRVVAKETKVENKVEPKPQEVTPVIEKVPEEFPVLELKKFEKKVEEKVQQKVQKRSPIKPLEEEMKKLESMKVQGMEGSIFSYLIDELIVEIFSYSKPTDLGRISLVCKEWLRITGDKILWKNLFNQYFPGVVFESRSIQGWKHIFANEKSSLMNGLICFHTKASFKDSVLGIPINFSTNPRTQKIDKISSTLDLISYEAYAEDGVRRSVWKVPFKLWLPLYINQEHGDRAFNLMKKTLAELCLKKEREFEPSMALEVLPKLMNTMVVSVMNGDLHASQAALEGYCAFHRLLLFFVRKYPELQKTVNDTAIHFIKKEEFRTKDVVPALGEFLPLLTVADKVTWEDVRMPYLYENFDRNALWTIKKYPHLARIEKSPVSLDRIEKTFDATQVSIKLLMFHVYFFHNVARPHGISLDEVAANYDAFYGRPSNRMKEALQAKVKSILKISTWDEFFRGIDMKPMSPGDLCKWLRTSVKNSARKGYHYNTRRG